MALHLNLLHEEIKEQRLRQRDPLKIGLMVLGALGALMLLFYMVKAYQTLSIKSQLGSVQHEWSKVEPQVTAAQKRSRELNMIINTTRVLDTMMEGRFYWGPLLQKLSVCVAPNAQLKRFDGGFGEKATDGNKLVTLTIEGSAAGREPRAAAEELRQLLLEQLSQSYSDAKVEFKSLEDLDTMTNVAGTNMPVANFIISVTLNPMSPEAAKAAAAAKIGRPKK